jgi:hypothetical protein
MRATRRTRGKVRHARAVRKPAHGEGDAGNPGSRRSDHRTRPERSAHSLSSCQKETLFAHRVRRQCWSFERVARRSPRVPLLEQCVSEDCVKLNTPSPLLSKLCFLCACFCGRFAVGLTVAVTEVTRIQKLWSRSPFTARRRIWPSLSIARRPRPQGVSLASGRETHTRHHERDPGGGAVGVQLRGAMDWAQRRGDHVQQIRPVLFRLPFPSGPHHAAHGLLLRHGKGGLYNHF